MSDSNHPFDRAEFSLKKKRSKKPLVIIGILAAVLLLVGGGVYFFKEQLLNTQPKEDLKTSQQQRGDVDEEALGKTTASAAAYMADGKTDTAVTVINDAIKGTNSSAQKSALYHNKATILSGVDASAAIKAAEESVALNPNFENTAYLAELYERNGDKEKAIEYYGKTIALYGQMPDREDGGSVSAGLYQDRIDRLRGQ